jgi:RNA polymerase sigma-70 factor (ECF subfamily)
VPLEEEALNVSVRATQEDGLEMRDLMAALARLPDEFREVVLLVGLEQLRYEEVAQVLGIPLGTVMSRLARGRERLRALMSGTAAPALRRVK